MNRPPIGPEELPRLLGVPFTPEQLAAVTAPLEPALIVAGAGSGKTTVMAARVVWLVASGQVRPEQVLGLTFTSKAAGELAARIASALSRAGLDGFEPAFEPAGEPAEQLTGMPMVSTYHAYAGRLFAEHALLLGLEPQARLLADASRFQLAGRAVRAAAGPFPDLRVTVSTVVQRVVGLEAELSEHAVGPEQVLEHDRQVRRDVDDLLAALGTAPGSSSHRKELAAVLACLSARAQLLELVQGYRQAKRALGAIDFGDQVAFGVALAETFPQIGSTERDRYAVVLLDEYQDTSVAQRRMLAALFPDGHPVTAVGDPCQAIYGWRGASVANLDGFPRHFPRRDRSAAPRYSLAVNQRSGGRLLTLANTVAAPLRSSHRVEQLQCRPGVELAGEVIVGLLPSWSEEVAWVARQVVAALATDPALRPADAAVLVRVTRDLPVLHAALVAAGLPVDVVGLGGLLAVPAVGDVVAMLQVLADPAAGAPMLRLLAGPRWRIGRRDLQLLGRRAAELAADPAAGHASGLEEVTAAADPADLPSLTEAVEDPGPAGYSTAARERFALAAAELRELRRHLGEPLVDLVARVCRVSGLDVELAASPEAAASGGPEALTAFFDVAAGYSGLDGELGVTSFLAYLEAAREHDRGLELGSTVTTGTGVQLLTMHKAKGLEWEIVALPDLTRNVMPSTTGVDRWISTSHRLPAPVRGDYEPGGALPTPAGWSKQLLAAYKQDCAQRQELEETRLAYVALTRAKARVIASSHWWGDTQRRPRGPSALLVAIQEHAAAGHGAVLAWADEPTESSNPYLDPAGAPALVWPAPLAPDATGRRRWAAAAVRSRLESMVGSPMPLAARSASFADPLGQLAEDPGADTPADDALLEQWDEDIEVLLQEARADREAGLQVAIPATVTASELLRLHADPAGFARELARPMPRPPAPAANLGTRFHRWVERRFGLLSLLDPEDVPGAAEDRLPPPVGAELAEEAEFELLVAAFLASPWAARAPFAVEAPFELVLGARLVRGRIDAVYRNGPGRWQVIDWKTGREASDPLQLAVYRLAWARLQGVEPGQVRASFLIVRTGELVTPERLAEEDELVAILDGAS